MGASGSAPAFGLGSAAQQVLASLIDIGRTRLELATVELEEERLRLARLFVIAAVALFLLFVGVVLAAGCIVLLVEPAHRAVALGGLSGVFLAAGGGAAWHWQRLSHGKPPLLHATLAELHQDRGSLPSAP